MKMDPLTQIRLINIMSFVVVFAINFIKVYLLYKIYRLIKNGDNEN